MARMDRTQSAVRPPSAEQASQSAAPADEPRPLEACARGVAGGAAVSTLRSFVTIMVGTAPWRIAFTLTLTISLSLIEGVGIVLVVPLLQLVGLDVQRAAVGRIAELAAATLASLGLQPTLITVLGVYLAVVGIRTHVARWQAISIITIRSQIVAQLRRRLYRAIVDANWLYFSRHRSADFVHVLTAQVDRVGLAMQTLLGLLADVVIAVVYLYFALQLSLVATAVVAVCGASLWAVVRPKAGSAHAIGEAIVLASNQLHAAASEHLDGLKTAKSYGVQERNFGIFSALIDRVAQTGIDASRNQTEVRWWFEVGSTVILSVMLFILIEVLAVPTAGILLLILIFLRLIPKLSNMQWNYQYLVQTLPALNSVAETLTRCEAAAERQPLRSERLDLRHEVRLEHVSFSYYGLGTSPAIRDLDLVIRAGATTALVGPSGAGKSTIADLIMGLIEPHCGRVLVDGVPLSAEHRQSWRDRIGYVGQDTFLIHDTVRANLRWACPDASEEDIQQALRLAAAEEFVNRLPQGIDTVVGDRGVLMSGGERQRLALARALLRRPSLLILDEPTSNLDADHERRIEEAIKQLRGRMTIVLITHRLAMVRKADVIHVLEGGGLVESGSWPELTATARGPFHALWSA